MKSPEGNREPTLEEYCEEEDCAIKSTRVSYDRKSIVIHLSFTKPTFPAETGIGLGPIPGGP